jgi:hypothetical protein
MTLAGTDRVRHDRRRDAPAIREGRIWPGAGLAAHGPHPARSLPARDPETRPRLHGLRRRLSWHGLVWHHTGRELHRAGPPPCNLAGESMGATVSLTASTELEDRVGRILAFNTYDYSGGVSRANRVAWLYVGGARLPAIGPVVAKLEKQTRPRHRLAGRSGRREQAAKSLPGRAASGRPSSSLPARGARGLSQRGQHDRRPSTIRSRHRPRHVDLRRSRLVANPRA